MITHAARQVKAAPSAQSYRFFVRAFIPRPWVSLERVSFDYSLDRIFQEFVEKHSDGLSEMSIAVN